PAALSIDTRGVTTTGVTVGSPAAGVAGSSVASAASSLEVTLPWLLTAVCDDGKGETTWARKVTAAELPATISPSSARTGDSAATSPWETWTEPASSVRPAGTVSLTTTPVAEVLPALATSMR